MKWQQFEDRFYQTSQYNLFTIDRVNTKVFNRSSIKRCSLMVKWVIQQSKVSLHLIVQTECVSDVISRQKKLTNILLCSVELCSPKFYSVSWYAQTLKSGVCEFVYNSAWYKFLQNFAELRTIHTEIRIRKCVLTTRENLQKLFILAIMWMWMHRHVELFKLMLNSTSTN